MPSMGNEYNKKYYEKNREKINNYNNERIRCDACEIEVSRVNKIKHEKSKKHERNTQKMINQNNLNHEKEKIDKIKGGILKDLDERIEQLEGLKRIIQYCDILTNINNIPEKII